VEAQGRKTIYRKSFTPPGDGIEPADGDLFMFVAPFLPESGAGDLLPKEAPKPSVSCPATAAKSPWNKALTPQQVQKLQDAMAKSADEKFRTGGFNAAMFDIMLEQGATPEEAYAATFGRFNSQ
jgi:hypothetical protein